MHHYAELHSKTAAAGQNVLARLLDKCHVMKKILVGMGE
jgi:hypothetical protein